MAKTGTSNYANKTRYERRKANRRIKALQDDLSSAKSQKARSRIRGAISEIEKAIEATRTYSKETGKRIRTAAEVAANVANLARLNISNTFLVGSNKKRNLATAKQINMAGSRDEGTRAASQYTKEQVRIFYRATQKAWDRPDVPIERRNEAIMRYYGSHVLSELFDEITTDARNQAIQRANAIIANPENFTDEDRQWAFEVIADNQDDFQLSPSGGALPAMSTVAPM